MRWHGETVAPDRPLAAPRLVRPEDLDRQADDPDRHAPGHLPRHLPGEGLRVLDREAARSQLQVLLGGAEPRDRRRRRQDGGRGDGGGARRARRVRHHLRRLQHRPLRRRHLPRHPRAVHRPHQARAGTAGRRADAAAPGPSRYDHLREIGVNRVSFCFEIFDRELFRDDLPRQAREYGLDHYLEAVRYCAALGDRGPRDEPWVSNGEIIAGLEPPESSIARHRLDHLGRRRFPPSASSGRSRAPTSSTPSRRETEEMIPVFRRLWEATMEAGLPIGVRRRTSTSRW
jgi:hypothetical protein